MSAAIPGTAVTSANPNTTTNTSLAVALGSTTVGTVNVVQISGLASGTGINPTMATPAGWTKKFEQMSNSGTPSTFVAVYYRVYQAGDASSVTFAWTNQGQMVAICTPFTNADTSSPIPYSTSIPHASGAGATYTITGTTGTDPGLLVYGGANKTGTAWSGLSDNANGQIGLSSSATMVSRVTAAELAGGTSFSKTMTGSASTIGAQWAFTVKGLTSVTAQRSTTWNVAGTLTSVTSQRSTTWNTKTRLSEALASLPIYIIHRGGDNDWVEMTRDAYTRAIANGGKIINIDAVRCSTGEFVASHDLTTGRVFGTNYTIATTPWSTLQSLTTTVGGFPIEKVSDLLAAFPDVVAFVENKGNSSDDSAFLDMLDAAGGPARIVVKQYYTAATVSTDAHARSYTTWGYYFPADVGNLAATQSRWDLLGLDYTDTNSTDWTNFLATGKLVIGHVITSAAGATQAFSEGANGIMTGKVLGVVPGNLTSVTSSRATTWNTYASVSVTRGTSWNVVTTVAASRATTWTVTTSATSQRSTTWVVAQTTTSQRSSSWNVARTIVSTTRTAVWDTLSSQSATRSTTWSAAARIAANRGTSWVVRSSVSASAATTWSVTQTVAASKATTWNTSGTSTGLRTTSWSTLSSATAQRGTVWNVDATGSVTATRATSWKTRATITATRATRWTVFAATTVGRTTTWETRQSVTHNVAATWGTLVTRTAQRTTTWNVVALVPVTASTATRWDTLASVLTQCGTTWMTWQWVETLRTTSWDVFASYATVERTTTWNVEGEARITMAIRAQRRLTLAVIAEAPVVVTLQPYDLVPTTSGGTRRLPSAPREPQTMRLIEPRGPEPVREAVTGLERRTTYELLGRWDATMAAGDTFTVPGDAGEWHITALYHDNGYERRAEVERRGG